MTADDALVRTLRTLEERLLAPDVRSNPAALAELLADDFAEFGSSGRVFDRGQIIEALQGETPVSRAIRDFEVRTLAPGVVLATYRIDRGSSSFLRSSVWASRGGRWRMVFHQGTPANPRGPIRLQAIAPQFLVDDLGTAIAYYRDRLGFAVDFVYESFYASVVRDGFPIHLKCAPKTAADRAHRRQHQHLDAHIAVAGVEALYRELQERGARITDPLEARPWACAEFSVEDADGYILCFSEPHAPT